MIDTKQLEKSFPKSWNELNEFYNEQYLGKTNIKLTQAMDLPFAFTVGIWMQFFQENGFDLDVQSLDLIIIEASVAECLQALENTISHFS